MTLNAIEVLWYMSLWMLFVTKFWLDTRTTPSTEKVYGVLLCVYIYTSIHIPMYIYTI